MKPHRVMVPRKNESTGKTFWVRVGSAWMKDGGRVSIKLDALPMGGELMVFPPDERDDKGGGQGLGSDDVPY
jgi:hypothetical protein